MLISFHRGLKDVAGVGSIGLQPGLDVWCSQRSRTKCLSLRHQEQFESAVFCWALAAAIDITELLQVDRTGFCYMQSSVHQERAVKIY
jgi:hypothetical protein